MTTCDNHSIYKTGSKEIADADGMSITFMAKPNAREGNSCHIHLSVRKDDGTPVMAGDGPHGLSAFGEHFIAGQLALLSELVLWHAPNINSYKRYVPGSFAPTAVRWGVDNRTCAMRLVGHGAGLRVENRVPGGDVNPYLAVAAMIAAGLHGVDHELPLEAPLEGNAYTAEGSRVPSTLRDALDLWLKSEAGPRGLRERRGRALRPRGPGGDRGVRRRGDRLGIAPGLRTDVGPQPRGSAHGIRTTATPTTATRTTGEGDWKRACPRSPC